MSWHIDEEGKKQGDDDGDATADNELRKRAYNKRLARVKIPSDGG